MGKTDTMKSILEEGLPDKTVKGIIETAAPDNVVAKGLNLAGGVSEHTVEAGANFLTRWLNKAGNWARTRTRGNL